MVFGNGSSAQGLPQARAPALREQTLPMSCFWFLLEREGAPALLCEWPPGLGACGSPLHGPAHRPACAPQGWARNTRSLFRSKQAAVCACRVGFREHSGFQLFLHPSDSASTFCVTHEKRRRLRDTVTKQVGAALMGSGCPRPGRRCVCSSAVLTVRLSPRVGAGQCWLVFCCSAG